MCKNTHSSWQVSHGWPLLAEDTVHIWAVPLDASAAPIDQLCLMLSPDEQARAAAFRFPHVQRRFVVARAALRQVLAGHLGATPESVAFQYGPSGKPALAAPVARKPLGDPASTVGDAGTAAGLAPLAFNLSHSADLALIAVTRGRAVGIDLEHLLPFAEADAIAEGYFCPAERVALRQCVGPAKQALFLTYWTRKEALLKATGDGLRLPLDAVDVSAVRGDGPAAVQVADGAGVLRHLTLLDLRPPGDYLGTVAVEGGDWQLARWHWPPTDLDR
jgi:4'-phosphopantetheinyl transferase